MLGFHFIFALAASSILCVHGQEEQPCWTKLREECDYSVFPDEVPTTVQGLRDVCGSLQELGACIMRVREDCTDDRNATERFRKILAYVHSVCREDSEVFQVVSSNLECLAAASETVMESCRMFSFSDATKELIMNLGSQYAARSQSGNGADEASCLESLWEAYCPSIKVGVRCGFEVGLAVKDILLNIDSNPMCTEKFIEEISPMLEVIELAIIEEELLKKYEEEEEESPSVEARRKRRFASPFQALRERFF